MTQSSSKTTLHAWNAVSNSQLLSWLGIDQKEFFDQLHNPLELGEAKLKIYAAYVLGRRNFWHANYCSVITSSQSAYMALSPKFELLDQEVFVVMYLNRAHHIQGIHEIARGGISSALVDLRLLFKPAIAYPSESIIVAHNHPSGVLRPSPEDFKLTERVIALAHMLGICVLDHLIMGPSTYYSFAEEGELA
ncbi:MAG: hypothetical protein CMN34_03960 [Saprospirales bacterium]|nr:hypothetical protein [Saprospirales bacterium]